MHTQTQCRDSTLSPLSHAEDGHSTHAPLIAIGPVGAVLLGLRVDRYGDLLLLLGLRGRRFLLFRPRGVGWIGHAETAMVRRWFVVFVVFVVLLHTNGVRLELGGECVDTW